MDREDYIWEGKRQLANQNHYTALHSPIYPETKNMVKIILENMKGEGYINTEQLLYLSEDSPRERRFYLLPKIHKDKATWSKPGKIPPGRPIVSDCNSETYRIAEYIEFYLNPISNLHPSYIKDTYHFLEKIKTIKIPQTAFLFTMDVESLYTNIDTNLGLETIKLWFQKYPNPNRPDKYLLQLLEISLRRNDFEFDSRFYLQIKGTAMGKKFAPSYANIFMANWEEKALDAFPLKPLHYYRFLDDIWGIWPFTMEDFIKFANHLNTFTPSIRIQYNIHGTEVNFLDTITYKGTHFNNTGFLDFKVYFKETDTHSLLHKTSFHPKHTYRGIVKSQLLRFHRICSDQNQFCKATKTLFSVLRTRGYSRSFLRYTLKSFLKEKPPTQTQKIIPMISTFSTNSEKPPTQTQKIIPMISTFSTNSVQLNRLIKCNFQKFLTNTNILQHHKIIAAYRRNKNLKDRLVKSKLPSLTSKQKEERNKTFQPRTWVTNHSTKQIYKITEILTSKTTNCIYLISCAKCTKQYVGQTKNSMVTRLYQHQYNIRHHKEINTHIVKHFLEHGLTSLRISGLQSDQSWTLHKRLRMEKHWIAKLDTKYPKGLNED
ncbi:hypothetical protein ACEWY4_027632 [Coilia grayii]|uniref:GIY-YIG domain-containing protein n=1 Tax=Coilia grayii TaxID=363190 RepID=A0ABD1IP36_9TELE